MINNVNLSEMIQESTKHYAKSLALTSKAKDITSESAMHFEQIIIILKAVRTHLHNRHVICHASEYSGA